MHLSCFGNCLYKTGSDYRIKIWKGWSFYVCFNKFMRKKGE